MKALVLIALLSTIFSPCAIFADAREEARRDAERYERQREIRRQKEMRRPIEQENRSQCMTFGFRRGSKIELSAIVKR